MREGQGGIVVGENGRGDDEGTEVERVRRVVSSFTVERNAW